MMNTISLADVYEDLSGHQKKEINLLEQFLELQFSDEARIAQSIITRGELQIFGCSSPRFVCRLYFKNQGGFVNVRRLRPLAGNPHRKERGEPANPQYRDITQQEISEILNGEKQSCIADCLLPAPPPYAGLPFHFLRAELNVAYGENLPGETLFFGTPYLKNVTLGGGLCSQACCFMAAAILHKFAKGIHGLAEITALAHPERRRILSISDMNSSLMASYFSAIDLAMTDQKAVPHSSPHNHTVEQVERIEFENAIRSYLLSGMPVILPVDTGKMLGYFSLDTSKPQEKNKSIYASNGLTVDAKKFDRTRPDYHCIVLVGCEKSPDPTVEAKIFFNDPSYLPFMWAYASELLEACPYMRAGGELDPKMARGRFWTVTPDVVKMPLLDYIPQGAYEYRQGLRWISSIYHDGAYQLATKQESRFLLIQLDKLSKIARLEPFVHSTPLIINPWDSVRRKLNEIGRLLQEKIFWSKDHWVWLEIMAKDIHVWDAEVEPLSTYSPIEYLVARLYIYDQEMRIDWPKQFELD